MRPRSTRMRCGYRTRLCRLLRSGPRPHGEPTLNVLAGTKDHIENQFELERKRSLQIASVGLKAINQHPNKFGVIHWPMSLIEWR